MSSVAEIERDLDSLDRERSDSVAKIRRLQHKFDRDTGSFRKHRRDERDSEEPPRKRQMITVEGGKRKVEREEDDSAGKSPSKKSADEGEKDTKDASSSVEKTDESGETSITITMDGVEEEKKKEKPKRRPDRFSLTGDSTDRTRNRRLFAGLLGTLRGAKDRFNKESKDGPIKQQGDARQKAVQRVIELKAADKKRLEVVFKREKLEELTRQKGLLEKQRALQLKLITTAMTAHQAHMQHYIRTKASPPIYWLPKKHNDNTQALLTACQEQADTKEVPPLLQTEEEKKKQAEEDAALDAEIATVEAELAALEAEGKKEGDATKAKAKDEDGAGADAGAAATKGDDGAEGGDTEMKTDKEEEASRSRSRSGSR